MCRFALLTPAMHTTAGSTSTSTTQALSSAGPVTEAKVDGVVALALGFSHSILIKQDGSVWTTGVNNYGQLGQGTRNGIRAFTLVISSGAKSVDAGASHSIVLKQDGSVWTVGQNSYGQIGDGLKYSRSVFVQVISGAAKAVAAGGYHSMVLRQDGGVWATGWNKYGQLGGASTTDKRPRSEFVQVMSSGAKAMAAGDLHSMVLKEDGSVWATGGNNLGQLGDGSKTDRSSFVEVMSSGAEAVAAGGCHSMVLKQDGSVWATGGNMYGQLGDGSLVDKTTYVRVFFSFNRAETVAAGSRHSMVLTQDGSVWVTGRNEHGQLGDGSGLDRRNFVQVFVSGAKAVAAGSEHSMLLTQDGSVWVTGSNQYGQLSYGSTSFVKAFVKIGDAASTSATEGPAKEAAIDGLVMTTRASSAGFNRFALGGRHSLMLKQDGSVWSTGHNRHGQLGDGGRVDSSRFTCTVASGAKAVAAGGDHSMALKQDGSVWVAGSNLFGQLGESTAFQRTIFFRAMSGGAEAVAAGRDHSLVLATGGVWATGRNHYGQLGDGFTVDRGNFVLVLSEGTKAIAAGGDHSIVLKQDGSVWSTGFNFFGQLGDGSNSNKRSFVMVLSGNAVAVAAGTHYSLVLGQNGAVWATGRNSFGQLGDGSTADHNTFTMVVSSGANAVDAGYSHSIVLREDGSMWGTGSNVHGQLGDGSTTDTSSFMKVISSGAEVVAAGSDHSMMLTQDGSVWATGWNLYGQLGDGSITSRKEFVKVAEISDSVVLNPNDPTRNQLPSDFGFPTRASIAESATVGSASTMEAMRSAKPAIGEVALVGTRTPPLIMPGPTAVSRVCPKCGTIKKSGKRSCCASGGAWFNKCGDAGDTNFDHTWLEGIRACRTFPETRTTLSTKVPVTATPSEVSSNGCPKCGTIKKSGKLSCCARGGAWFNKCGDAGDTDFDHTWVEGIQACKTTPETRTTESLSAPAGPSSEVMATVPTAAMTLITTAEVPVKASVSVESSNGCPKCEMIKKSGKLSCCARGGAWFNNCGDAGDTDFDHTWVEGIQACTTAGSSKGCPKCGTIKKSGKLSCCARGGAWFNKCGDAGDTDFDHTWVEGIQACKAFASSFPNKPPAPAMFLHEKSIAQPLNFTVWRNSTQQQGKIYSRNIVSDADATDSEDCVELAKIAACASLLFVSLNLQL